MTRAVTQTHIGIRRAYASALLTETDLAQPRREDGSIVAVEPDLGRGGRDLAQDLLAHGRPAGELLERGHVRLGDAIDPVLAVDEVARAVAHRPAHLGI